jgi:hypothetical protein
MRSIEVDNKLYSVTNTSIFDNIVQIICSSYIDSNTYAEWLNTN